MGKFYALLVGINQYEVSSVRFPEAGNIDLSGCLNDVALFKTYLEEKIPVEGRQIFEPLLDQNATKENVIKAIQTQLGEASPDDTALFYFSGHGCLEEASNTIRQFTVGDEIEALVCHDSLAGDSTTPLADLEIRYLFHQLAAKEKPPGRIIIITDSCNSGGVTRSLFNTGIRRLGPVAGLRNWDQFIFHEKISEEQVKNSPNLDSVLPKARHIHLAACENQQSAFESSGQNGVFTRNLIQVLDNTGGRTSFRDLHSRVKYLVRRRFKDQTPQIYAYDPAGDSTSKPGRKAINKLMDTSFLKGLSTENKLSAGIHYFVGNWVVDKGALHGMPPTDIAKEKINIQIIESREGGDINMPVKVDILEVLPGTTSIGFVGNLLDKDHVERYRAKIEGLYLDPLNVHLIGDEEAFIPLKDPNLKYAQQLAERNIQLLKATSSASPDYKVIADEESYLITSPRDADDAQLARPLCQKIPRSIGNPMPDLVHYLSTIARWQFVLGLSNLKRRSNLHTLVDWEFQWTPATGILGSDEIEEEQRLAEQSFNPDKGRPAQALIDQLDCPVLNVELPTPPSPEHTPYMYFRLRIHNRSRDPLYVSLLYLGQLFDVSSENFRDQPNIVQLEGASEETPGDSVWAFGTPQSSAIFELSDFIYTNNWEEDTFFLKLLISNTEFELGNTLDQIGLPEPDAVGLKGGDGVNEYRSATHPDIPDWTTKMMEVRVKNPFWKRF